LWEENKLITIFSYVHFIVDEKVTLEMNDRLSRRRKRLWSFIQPYLTIIQTIAVGYSLFKRVSHVYKEEDNDILSYFWIIVSILCYTLWGIARLQLGPNLTFTPSAGRQLVTTGIYRYFRHPVYYFSTLGLLSYAFMTKEFMLLWLLLIIVPLQVVRALKEKKVLLIKYDEDYEAYERRVWI
jgi:protein-S-isoprenylcysteine O-methyltransferase Ste14